MWLPLVDFGLATLVCECGLWLCVPQVAFRRYCGFVEIELLASCMFTPGFANLGLFECAFLSLSFFLWLIFTSLFLSLPFSFFVLSFVFVPSCFLLLCLVVSAFVSVFSFSSLIPVFLFLVSFFCLLLSSLFCSFSLIKLVLLPLSLRTCVAAFVQLASTFGQSWHCHTCLCECGLWLCVSFFLFFPGLLPFLSSFLSFSLFFAPCFSLIPPFLFLSFLLLCFLFLLLSLYFSAFLCLSLSFSFFNLHTSFLFSWMSGFSPGFANVGSG